MFEDENLSYLLSRRQLPVLEAIANETDAEEIEESYTDKPRKTRWDPNSAYRKQPAPKFGRRSLAYGAVDAAEPYAKRQAIEVQEDEDDGDGGNLYEDKFLAAIHKNQGQQAAVHALKKAYKAAGVKDALGAAKGSYHKAGLAGLQGAMKKLETKSAMKVQQKDLIAKLRASGREPCESRRPDPRAKFHKKRKMIGSPPGCFVSPGALASYIHSRAGGRASGAAKRAAKG